MEAMNFKTTAEIKVPTKIVDQIVGQDPAVNILKKVARQRRHLLLIGQPGIGKSLVGQALAELLPKEKLVDILSFPNQADENIPLIRTVARGQGKKIVSKAKMQEMSSFKNQNLIFFILLIITMIAPWWIRKYYGDIMAAASLIGSMIFLGAFVIFINLSRRINIKTSESGSPRLLIDNSATDKSPFIDATGAHSGALLGDCLHDPLQTIFPDTIVYLVDKEKIKPVGLSKLVDSLLENNKTKIEKNFEGYEGLMIPESSEIFVLGHKDNKVQPVKIMAVNKRLYDGEMFSVKTNYNRVVLTPEHKVLVNNVWIEAKDTKDNPQVLKLDKTIIDEEDILKTFKEKERISALNYKKYLKLRQEHPEFGYKKIAKILNIKQGQVRWWHHIGSKPISIKKLESLKKKDLIPLKFNNTNIDKIARILGTTFGDGGIFGNLNAIYLSSSELDTLKDYGSDLRDIFGKEIDKNFEFRISGRKNTGKCLMNTNREAVRFFVALGGAVGRKNKEIIFPSWVKANELTKKEFFGAFLGNELCSPTFSKINHYINSLDVAICGDYSLRQNRLNLLEEIKLYLNSYGVKCSENIYENEFRPCKFSWRLCISKELQNMIKFKEFILIRYSKAKSRNIENALKEQFDWKIEKYKTLLSKGKSVKYITSTLKAEQNLLQLPNLNQIAVTDKKLKFKGHIYNLTTESGNLFANGILISNSGGFGTPAHERLIPGMIHRANGGVLFIDEIANLNPKSQQELLTALQEKKYSITGQSERSSGAMTRSEAVPCDFVLVAAGNPETIRNMHPALRSRIRGYGYEVYMDHELEDNAENRNLFAKFIAQEVTKDGKIPHFTKEAVLKIIEEAKRRSNTAGKLTLKLRELGGLVRAAGDLALEEKAKYVESNHIEKAMKLARTLEQQMADKYIEQKKRYQVITTQGRLVGKVNGLAVMGDEDHFSGIVLPIESEVTPGGRKAEFIATGQLGKIAKEAIKNVSAIILKYFGEDIHEKYDIFVQFLQTADTGVEGDSASISVATAIVSALKKIPARQDIAMTGSLSVRGEVLAVGGVSAKIEAAIEAGIKEVIIPKANEMDVLLSKENQNKIKIIPASTIQEVLKHALYWKGKEKLLKKLTR